MYGEILFFQSIVNTIGSFVKCDEGTRLQSRMNKARVCVRIRELTRLNLYINANIDDTIFIIQVVEEEYHRPLSEGSRGWEDESVISFLHGRGGRRSCGDGGV